MLGSCGVGEEFYSQSHNHRQLWIASLSIDDRCPIQRSCYMPPSRRLVVLPNIRSFMDLGTDENFRQIREMDGLHIHLEVYVRGRRRPYQLNRPLKHREKRALVSIFAGSIISIKSRTIPSALDKATLLAEVSRLSSPFVPFISVSNECLTWSLFRVL